MSSTKHNRVWLLIPAFAVVLMLAACKPGDPGRSTGAYPIDIFQEMHYNQSYKAQEPPRVSPPEGSIPISGGYIPAPDMADAKNLANPFSVSNGDVLERGTLLFRQNCYMCHGATGGGDGYVGTKFAALSHPPAFHNDVTGMIQIVRDSGSTELTPGEAYAAISNGFGGMPAFQKLLSEEDRWALVTLLEEPMADRVQRLSNLDQQIGDLTGQARVENEIQRQLRLNELRGAE